MINFNEWDNYNDNNDYVDIIKKKSIIFYNFLNKNNVLNDYINIIKSSWSSRKLKYYYNNEYTELNMILPVFKCGTDSKDLKWNKLDIKWLKYLIHQKYYK